MDKTELIAACEAYGGTPEEATAILGTATRLGLIDLHWMCDHLGESYEDRVALILTLAPGKLAHHGLPL